MRTWREQGPHPADDRPVQGRQRALHRLWRGRPLDPGRPLEAARHQAEAFRRRDEGLCAQGDRSSANGAPSRACRSPITTTWRRWSRPSPSSTLFMKHSGEGIPLLLDAGHLAFAGGDVLRAIDKHHARISHVHVKDVRMAVIDGLDRTKAVLPRRGGRWAPSPCRATARSISSAIVQELRRLWL